MRQQHSPTSGFTPSFVCFTSSIPLNGICVPRQMEVGSDADALPRAFGLSRGTAHPKFPAFVAKYDGQLPKPSRRLALQSLGLTLNRQRSSMPVTRRKRAAKTLSTVAFRVRWRFLLRRPVDTWLLVIGSLVATSSDRLLARWVRGARGNVPACRQPVRFRNPATATIRALRAYFRGGTLARVRGTPR